MTQPSWIGRSLSNRYRIDALLGQGGMSSVFKATDPNLKRVVAIKLIHSHLSGDAQFIKRFEEEAAAVASLRHPNIIQVFDFNADQDVYYMVLEFIAGETLQDRLKRLSDAGRAMPLRDAVNFTLNICSALGYAHQRGIIHRDIKPANIMLDIHSQAILMDFGIVKIIGGDSHTATGAVIGTARYMSPEVIRAEVPDERADVYSLGITLFEMLSGHPPFVADSAMTLMMMHLNDPVPDPRTLRNDIPAELVNIIYRSLEKDRNLRYRTTAEMAADLQYVLSVLDGTSAPAPKPVSQPSQPVTAPRPAPANPPSQPLTSPTGEPTLYGQPISRQYTSPPPVAQTPPSATYSQPQYQQPAPKKAGAKPWLIGIIGILFVCAAIVILGGAYMFSGQFGKAAVTAPPDTSAPSPTNTEAVIIIPTDTSQPEPTATHTPAPPTETPSPEPTATATYPPLYVRINSITVNASGQYVVEYETFGYTEQLPGQHIHFFFNTVAPEQAGSPGSGPWILYGGPRPFTKYTTNDKPAAATQMCALVANANHSVIAASGNCLDLP